MGQKIECGQDKVDEEREADGCQPQRTFKSAARQELRMQ